MTLLLFCTLPVVVHQPAEPRHAFSFRKRERLKCRIDSAPQNFEGGWDLVLLKVRQRVCPSQNRLGRFNSDYYASGDMEIDRGPLREVHVPLRESRNGKPNALNIVRAMFGANHDLGIEKSRLVRALTDWLVGIRRTKACVSIHQIVHVRSHEQRSSPPARELALNRWCEHRGEYRRDSSDSGPCLPIDPTSVAEPPALANTICHRPQLAEQSHVVPLSLFEPILP